MGIPAKLIRLVRLTITNVTCQVKVYGKLSGPFVTTKGLGQGDGLACLLFNLELERAIRDSRVETLRTIFYKSTQILAYAGLAGDRKPWIAYKQGKFKPMVAKSTTVPTTNSNLYRRDVQIGERTFEVVLQFTYLGPKVSNDNSMEAKLRKNVGCQSVFLQLEKSVHLKEPFATDEAGTI